MNEQSDRIKRLKTEFNISVSVAVLGLVLCLFFGTAPGILTVISIIFAVQIWSELKKLQQSSEKNLKDKKDNKRALIIFGVFIFLFLLVAAIASIYSPS